MIPVPAIRSSLAVLSISIASGTALADFVPGAALMSPALTGTTQYDGWIGLTAANYPGFGAFPGSSPWPGAIGSNRTTTNTFNAIESGDATLAKGANGSGGGPYLAGASVYFGGFSSTPNTAGGSLRFSDTTPVANLANVVFQVQIAEAWTHDFLNDALPVLSFNGGTQNLVATTALVIDAFDNGTVTMPTGEETVYINTHLLQWDLSSIAEPITDFSITFSGVQHALVYGAQINQSDVYTLVPAPGAAALLGLAGLLGARRRR